MNTSSHPIVIVGAGPLGLCAALRLHQLGHAVHVLDARPHAPTGTDKSELRTLALSHGSRQLLSQLKAWPSSNTPITTIHISQRGHLGRTLLRHSDYQLPALGYTLSAHSLNQQLLQQALAAKISVQYDASVTQLLPENGLIAVHYRTRQGDTHNLQASLALCCEGQIEASDATIGQRDYQQHALLLNVNPTSSHANQAWERFTPDGTIALLPQGQDYSAVWTVSPQRAAALAALPSESLLAEFQSAFGTACTVQAISVRGSYPLKLSWRKQIVGPRTVWLGNAAQTLHPVAGQGFNLALRDLWQLSELLTHASDAGDATLLQRYQTHRQTDRQGAIHFTDTLVRLFDIHTPLFAHARGAALLALDLCPPLRHFVAKRMIFGARAWL